MLYWTMPALFIFPHFVCMSWDSPLFSLFNVQIKKKKRNTERMMYLSQEHLTRLNESKFCHELDL